MANCRIRFMTNNLLTATATATPANSGFPFANCLTTDRDKYWSPSGHFLIDATNNKIYINDGSLKTVTLTSGSYATGAALALHIQTQLNAASTSWHCQHDATTYLFAFGRGGGGTLIISNSTNAAWNTLGFVGTTDIFVTYPSPIRWADEQRNHTSIYVTIDLGVQTEVSVVGVIGPIDEVFSVSETGTIRLLASNVNDFSAPAATFAVTRTDAGAFLFIDEAINSIYRYWRLEIIDVDNPSGPDSFKLGHIYIGGYETITSSNVARGFNKQFDDPSIKMQSESGKLYFDTRIKSLEIYDIVIQNATSSDKETIEQIGHTYGISTPLFVALDPLVKISTDISEYMRFVRFKNTPRITHQILSYYTIGLSFAEAI